MDIDSLRTFVLLSETGNFTKTSQFMFIAQSTVSNRINELERELGVRLFERNNRSVTLTRQGEEFLDYARKVIDLTDDSIPDIVSGKDSKTIRIGCADTIYECHLGKELQRKIRKDKKTNYMVSIGHSAELNEQLQNDVFDVIYTFIPLRKAKFKCEPYKRDEMVLVTDHNNTKYRSITREELIKERYIMCDFALKDVGSFIRNIFPEHHRFPIEINDCSKVAPMLFGTDFYTFLPTDIAEPLIKEKKLRKVRLKDLNTPVICSYIVRKK